MNRHKILYYSDSSTDDFAGTNIRTNHIGEDFCYIHHSFFWKALSALLYYCVALPLVWIAAKVYLGIKIENRDVLRGLRHTGYYLYGNHINSGDHNILGFRIGIFVSREENYGNRIPSVFALPFP